MTGVSLAAICAAMHPSPRAPRRVFTWLDFYRTIRRDWTTRKMWRELSVTRRSNNPWLNDYIRHTVVFGLRTGGRETVLHTATNVVCGDAYLINGQSNAVAKGRGRLRAGEDVVRRAVGSRLVRREGMSTRRAPTPG